MIGEWSRFETHILLRRAPRHAAWRRGTAMRTCRRLGSRLSQARRHPSGSERRWMGLSGCGRGVRPCAHAIGRDNDLLNVQLAHRTSKCRCGRRTLYQIGLDPTVVSPGAISTKRRQNCCRNIYRGVRTFTTDFCDTKNGGIPSVRPCREIPKFRDIPRFLRVSRPF